LDDVILWLPSGTASEKTGDRWQGEDVLAYPIPRGSKVILEAQIPITVGDLQLMKDLAERGRGRAVTVFQKSANTTKGKPSIGALLIGAFELGWHIGEKIDEETGASDKISDWLAENFPWPW